MNSNTKKNVGVLYLEYTLFTPLCTYLAESRFKAKHSLDSDEEDEPDPVQESGLGDEDLAAQEDTTIVKQLYTPQANVGCAECDVFALFSNASNLMMGFR